MEASMKNISNNQEEVRLKDRHGHFLGKILNGIVYVYCKRCKEFIPRIIPKGGKEDMH